MFRRRSHYPPIPRRFVPPPSGTWYRTPEDAFFATGGLCWYCGDEATTVDHIHPQSRGGDNIRYFNLLPACRRCNSSKNDAPLRDFRQRMGERWVSELIRKGHFEEADRQTLTDEGPHVFWGERHGLNL